MSLYNTSPSTGAHDSFARRHIAWASRIKEQHHHLQRALKECTSHPSCSMTAARQEKQGVSTAASEDSTDDFTKWRQVLESPQEQARLQQYADAMYNLATKYWEASPVFTTENGEEPVAPANTDGSDTIAMMMSDSATILNTSRKRDAAGEPVSSTGFLSTGTGVPLDALQKRRYNDRVRWSLDCVSEYYLGVAAASLSTATLSEPSNPYTTTITTTVSSPSTSLSSLCASSSPPLNSLFETLPLIFSRALKPLRRKFYEEHKRVATVEEVEGVLLPQATAIEVSAGAGEASQDYAWWTAMSYVEASRALLASTQPSMKPLAAAARAAAPPPLYALDIGSCYGPFFGKRLHHAVLGEIPLRVIAMDLAPYWGQRQSDSSSNNSSASQGESVLLGDWLNMHFFTHHKGEDKPAGISCCMEDSEGPLLMAPGSDGRVMVRPVCAETTAAAAAGSVHSGDGHYEALAVAAASFDVVFFCLLLSYMPTPRLRYLACLHAFLALKEGGLLVVVSTRTQGSHKATWVKDWTACMSSIGFVRVHQSVREQIVGLSFEKRSQHCFSACSLPLSTEEGRRRWVAECMTSTEAGNGFRIMADEQQL